MVEYIKKNLEFKYFLNERNQKKEIKEKKKRNYFSLDLFISHVISKLHMNQHKINIRLIIHDMFFDTF